MLTLLSPAERAERLQRWIERLQSLPSIALPTDYPRPTTSQYGEELSTLHLSGKARTALVRLAVHHDIENGEAGSVDEEGDEDDQDDQVLKGDSGPPSPFHLLLAAFTVILHRYTGDTDIIIGSSSPLTGEPLILRISIEAGDPFWQVVRKVQQVEKEAAEDCMPYEDIVEELEKKKDGSSSSGLHSPIFRVCLFDESGARQRKFMQSTSLTTDLTLFVTRPGVKMGGVFEDEMTASSETIRDSEAAATVSAPSRGSVVPDISLQTSYNNLIFSGDRIKLLMLHISHVVIAAAKNPSVPVGTVGLRTLAEDAILPDPCKDLDFCGFQGSITSIFERNAKSHPDRRCIVESLPSQDATSPSLPPPASSIREISYKELNEASNVLAHHLMASGLRREEVVTVYAHRGADLVVAVLGTLKAGGTFSVIDPAYPPSRQIIYLQVAKPRALVVLAKAGKLHASVRTCIEEELEIRTEVPGLELLQDGQLVGGQGKNGDVLETVQNKASQSTDLLLGPDSVATLSFTSGSTGIPKGVRGRHYSLTHFFPWMGQRFSLGSHSRFTMLSGIAHDPIQRDIFTPLFFGAELHVPTADDIGTPGRLAEWMAATEATVTHLTPAMGQLLSAQATAQIPSLRNSFFVGDVLTKRDCTRLQALAHNVRIINMYGTTETQRAVSYFEIPALAEKPTFLATQKDIMPAGQGMIDVQLLVVNRNERTSTCAVGEVGEIYVRSGGLAEGYLGPPEITAEKFIANFLATDVKFVDTLKDKPEGQYWKGVRDRMYRTGDLGRYLPDGRVECTGRADDQVKIRGFRIELGEIDTHLSQHAHVRENVTLVRRDKDEEKVLVSYFVPGPGASSFEETSGSEAEDASTSRDLVRGMRRHRRLIKDIREHLKKKLPAYSIPTLFVPIGKMPLNPNGKIDKPALPFPDTALASASLTDRSNGKAAQNAKGGKEASQTEQTVAELFHKLLPSCPQPIPLDESFFDLGGHSILATQLVFSMRKAFVVNVPLGVVFDSPTVQGLAHQVDKLKHADLNIGLDPNAATHNAAQSASLSPNGSNHIEQAIVGEDDYDGDVAELSALLPESFKSSSVLSTDTILVTGVTGFLGAFILRDLLSLRSAQVKKVIAHVRAKDASTALDRVREGCKARNCWDDEWIKQGRLEFVVGDLSKERLGLSLSEWNSLAQTVDGIIHNGALVHWVYPYSKLKSANVMSTVTAIQLCAIGKPKTLTFVSSTAALDTDYYVRLSDSLIHASLDKDKDTALRGIPETDNLKGSSRGLNAGYGQSKYVGERLIMIAAQRGLRASIVRPGYVVGDSKTAVTNTDDFLWRLVKGSIQLGMIPGMHNTVNMTPVDHVARIVSLASIDTVHQTKPWTETFAKVYHVDGHPSIRYNDLLGALRLYGWPVNKIDYVLWRAKLEEHVLHPQTSNDETNALFPLLHFVLDDLPTSTKSAELDDRQTQNLLKKYNEDKVIMGVDEDLIGFYLAWLVAVGYLSKPTLQPGQDSNKEKVTPLPDLQGENFKAIGRGSAN